MAKADFWTDLALAYQHVEDARETLSEISAQHRGECYAFGDSWPGAVLQIEHAARSVRAAEARVKRMEAIAFG